MTIERIVAGAKPTCRLSHRALDQIRDRLAFVDADSLSMVSDGRGRVVIWAFAGSAATGSIAAGLAAQGFEVIGFDDLAITLRTRDREHVAKALSRIDPVAVYPKLPEDIEFSLKFGLCLPAGIVRSVLKARTADPAAVAAMCRRTPRLISSA